MSSSLGYVHTFATDSKIVSGEQKLARLSPPSFPNPKPVADLRYDQNKSMTDTCFSHVLDLWLVYVLNLLESMAPSQPKGCACNVFRRMSSQMVRWGVEKGPTGLFERTFSKKTQPEKPFGCERAILSGRWALPDDSAFFGHVSWNGRLWEGRGAQPVRQKIYWHVLK